jgi:hypothetical protein
MLSRAESSDSVEKNESSAEIGHEIEVADSRPFLVKARDVLHDVAIQVRNDEFGFLRRDLAFERHAVVRDPNGDSHDLFFVGMG